MHYLAAAATQQDPLIPSLPELIVGTICFLFVFGFLGKMFLPRIQQTLDDVSSTIILAAAHCMNTGGQLGRAEKRDPRAVR